MDGKQEHKDWTGFILAAGLLFFSVLLFSLDVHLGLSDGFRYAGYFRAAFLFICISFLVGTAVGLTQLRKR